MISAHVFTIGSWNPGIGDPSLMGWFTVYSYYLTAGVYLLKIYKERRWKPGLNFWGSICFGMVFLGVIKQYNSLSALTELGRIFARSGGWLEQRRIVQLGSMVAVTGVFILAVIRISKRPAKIIRQNILTYWGLPIWSYLYFSEEFHYINLEQF